MGLELDEGFGLAVVEEEPGSWRRTGSPFTVEPGADGLPAGALCDMGRTSGTQVCGRVDRACNDDSLGMAGGRIGGEKREAGKVGQC